MKILSKYKKGLVKVAKSVFTVQISLLAAGGMLLSSCGDFLEIEPQNEITLDKFWNEKSDVEAILAGCYSTMQGYPIISRMMIWGEYRSENVNYCGDGNDDQSLERLLKENITANNYYTTWGDFYTIINRCNTVLKYAPGVADVDPSYSQSQLKAHIAEAVALRSLMYFYLIRTFRDVPYSEEAFLDDDQQMAIPATSFDDVLSKLITSLEAVKNDALTAYQQGAAYSSYYNTGRVTKTAIYAMLADMYLWQKNYAKCIEYANWVIEQKKIQAEQSSYTASEFANFGGYPIIGTRYRSQKNTYGQSFNAIFVNGNSLESIFELTFIKGSGDTQLSNGPFSNFYGGQGRSPMVKASSYVAQDEVDKSYKVFDAKNAGLDARAYENLIYTSNTPTGINKNTCQSGFQLNDVPTNKDFFKNSRWGQQYPTTGTDHVSQNKANFIFYRTTDVMLMAAEAASQLINDTEGGITEDADVRYRDMAFNLVNAVNKRSLMQETLKDTLVLKDYNTKEKITNLVYQERARELMFEGKRYFDLVRHAQRDGDTKYIREQCSNKNPDLKSVINSKMQKMDAIYWPYNIDEIKANSFLKQNSAFGSGENDSYKAN